jgi:hypothetical protein
MLGCLSSTTTEDKTMIRTMNYEQDNEAFPADYYHVDGWGAGIAFYILGWETEPDQDTEWSGYEVRTGNVLAVMVGDDYRHTVDPENITPLDSGQFCHSCGQIGCTHNTYT